MDWSIQEIARLAGTTSRALRHYDDIGLLAPSRVGANGYRYYDEAALVRLQRILLLRDLGLGLATITEVLDGQRDDVASLRTHLAWLRAEQARFERQLASVENTLTRLEKGEPLMAENMFDGFDHTEHKAEVEERWGAGAFAKGDDWWRAKSAEERAQWMLDQKSLASDWMAAAARGAAPDSDEAQALAQRQFDWLAAIPGTPRNTKGPTKEYFVGLGELYVADERFAANYGGPAKSAFVRDAMVVYAERKL